MFGVGSASGLKGLNSGWQVGTMQRLSVARNIIYLRHLGLGLDCLPFVEAQRLCFLSHQRKRIVCLVSRPQLSRYG